MTNSLSRRRDLLTLLVLALPFSGCKCKVVPPPSGEEKPTTTATSAPTGSTAPAGGPEAQTLLNEADVASFFEGAKLAKGPLVGQPRSTGYDSVRFSRVKDPDLGVAVQWWHLPSREEAMIRYQKELHGYASVLPKEEVGTHSFRAAGWMVAYVVFLDEPSNSVVAVDCGRNTCHLSPDAGDLDNADWSKLVALAKTVQSRLPH